MTAAACVQRLKRVVLEGLEEDTPPERSVALTFDDGIHDFQERAYPIIRTFGYPCTV